jgi:N-acetylglucosamine kinase-like BadF-type ATPase
MKLYLGIDGGGTKTKVIIIDKFGKIVFENTSGPSSIDTVDSFTTMNNIRIAIDPFIDKYPECAFNGVFAGLGGIVFSEDCQMVETLIRQLPQVIPTTFLRARNDMHNALYSSDHFDSGMTLICGTGMVAFGLKGELTFKSGGWGFKEGELGSGYHLGREAIRCCIRAFDGRYRLNAFTKEIASAIGLTKASDIIAIMEDYYGQRTKTASLAPIVTKHANLGNKQAEKICDLATAELALAIKAVYKKLKFEAVTLVIVGSLGNSKGYFGTKLFENIKKISDKIVITSPVIDPALAAAKAAKHFCEV